MRPGFHPIRGSSREHTALDCAIYGDGAEDIGGLSLSPGDRYPLLTIDASEEDALGTSAEAYRLWYRITFPTGDEGWVQAAIPTPYDTSSDGRPSSVRFDLLPGVAAPE